MSGYNSSAANPISGHYEQSERGYQLKQAEKDRDIRAAIRGRQLEVNGNANYNVINGLPRLIPEVPLHDVYNPSYREPHLDLAGKPLRANSNI